MLKLIVMLAFAAVAIFAANLNSAVSEKTGFINWLEEKFEVFEEKNKVFEEKLKTSEEKDEKLERVNEKLEEKLEFFEKIGITSAGTAYVLILCRFFSPYRAEKILSRH
jgi:hypothetical protein